ncbi:MAG: alpha/beta hydrolase [Kofleriaceae bacterium]
MNPVIALIFVAACASSPAPTANTATPAIPAPTAFRVEVSGHGPPILLVPGLASSGETWTGTVKHLGERYTCHVVTLAGFAGVPPIREPLVATVVTELAGYIDSHHLARPVVIGHSLGGEVALKLAAEHPDRVGPLVIVDSLPFLGAIMGAASVDEAKPMVEQLRAVFGAQTDAQYAAYVKAGTSTRSMVTADADHARIVGWGVASDRTTVGNAMVELLATDLRPQLAKIQSPVLVIGTWVGWDRPGAPADQAAVEATFREQYKTLPKLEFVMAATRHFVMLDDLPWFLGQVDRFLAR